MAEEEGQDLESLVEQLGGAGVVILGIHRGGGMIFNKDGLVEPAKQMVQERWKRGAEKLGAWLGFGRMKSRMEGQPYVYVFCITGWLFETESNA